MRTKRTLKRLALEGAAYNTWYTQQRQLIHAHCVAHGYWQPYFAGVLALTSPRRSVAQNWRVADAYARGQPVGMMGATRRALEHFERTGEVRGPKVAAFHAALLGAENVLVLDVWMARALGVPEGSVYRNKRTFRMAERRMRDVAGELGWTVAQTQAAIWAATIQSHGRKPGGFNDGGA